MLQWRIIIGVLLVLTVGGLAWLDHQAAPIPGVWLFPVLLVFVVLSGREVLELCEVGGIRPLAWVVHGGNIMLVSVSWIASLCVMFGPPGYRHSPLVGWHLAGPCSMATVLALAAAVAVAFLAEMLRYQRPGGVTVNVAATVFAMTYLGFLSSFMVQLRVAWGIGALASLLIVVKLADVGAYTVGRLVGRHKMAPELSPRKTIEGALGGLVFGTLGAWITFCWLVPALGSGPFAHSPWWGWLGFGVVVASVGMFGDLAESLIKRDFQRKDSSQWLPGFGGVLDILDSPLMAAPVAYTFWAFELVGR